MLTIFSTPKVFKDQFAVIQRNAICSWTKLHPDLEIILFGNDEGVADLASDLNLRHIPEVARNKYGTPLLSNIFEQAEKLASHNLLCYINADIVLMSDFVRAITQVARLSDHFLLIGERWDVDIDTPLEFGPGWEEQLKIFSKANGHLQTPPGMDYFVYTRGLWDKIPPFAIGRTAWDNWLVFRARARRVPVIDASPVIMAIHQNHDYSHSHGGKHGAWAGPEAKHNQRLMFNDSPVLFGLEDATHLLATNGLKRPIDYKHLERHLTTLPILYPNLRFLVKVIKKILDISRPLRAKLGLTFFPGEMHNAS